MTDNETARRIIAELEQLGLHVRMEGGSVFATWPNDKTGGQIPAGLQNDYSNHLAAITSELNARSGTSAPTPVAAATTPAPSKLASWSAARSTRRKEALADRLSRRNLN